MKYLFDIDFFKTHQRKLLWLLNTPIIKVWFRWVMRIRKYDCQERITEITPNSISWGDRYFKKKGKWYLERTTDFRTHNKYSKRLFYAFFPLWYLFHCWDMTINFLRLPALNLGFDTLTVYPDANPESTSVDGRIYTLNKTSYTLARDAASGDAFQDAGSQDSFFNSLGVPNDAGKYGLSLKVYLFDTSTMGANTTITAATMSIWFTTGGSKNNADSISSTIVETAPASNTSLAVGDFSSRIFTDLGSITFAAWTAGQYNDTALNATGLTKISKTGITKLGLTTSIDVSNTAPTGSNQLSDLAFADITGTANDPKLVVTYTLPTTGNFFLMFN